MMGYKWFVRLYQSVVENGVSAEECLEVVRADDLEDANAKIEDWAHRLADQGLPVEPIDDSVFRVGRTMQLRIEAEEE